MGTLRETVRAAIPNNTTDQLALRLRLAGAISICSGLIGGYVWFVDLYDRSDGDSLRWGFWHNPFMQFPPFNEPFLDLSMWVLLACSAAAGLGGILLVVPEKFGAWLVTWQARVSIVINGVIAFFIVASLVVFATNPWDEFYVGTKTYLAIALRLGSICVDLALWAFLTSHAVRGHLHWRAQRPARGFDVIPAEVERRA